ncbi:uncharacterized protein LOC142485404 [Ascaphus truei]|uniref:uncharacterized protein LOC142485404 n=1 Tax=Ascaphus truei TaxID=8439 RepID=UPI003F5A3A4D
MTGLTFAPTANPSEFELFIDLQKYLRKLTLHRHFANCKEIENNIMEPLPVATNLYSDPIEQQTYRDLESLFRENHTDSQTVEDTRIFHSGYKPKSFFYPYYSRGQYVELFGKLLEQEFRHICNSASIKKRSRSNMTASESLSIKNLRTNTDIVVREADKGGGVVIQDKKDYCLEAERLLSDPKSYKKLKKDPTGEFLLSLKVLLDEALDKVAIEGHVSPEREQVSSPGSASSTHLEEHDEEDYDDDDDDDDAAAAAIDTQIQASDHEEVPIETVLPPKRPANTTYDAIVASEGKIVEAENRRHSDLMTVLERMIALQEETVSQLAHLHRVFIEVPKQLQKINTSFEALVVQQTQANYWRMTNVPQFNTSQAGSVHAGQFSPHSSDIHSPGPNVTGQVADIAVQVPDDILPLPSVQIQQQTPTKEATKTKQDTHETDQPSLVQCLPTCSHVSVGTSPVREQSVPKSPVGESLPKSPVGESLPKSPVGESLPKSPVGESLPKSPVGESLATSPVGEQSLPKSPVGESLPKSPVGESLPKSPVGESLATSPAREVPEATQSGSVVPEIPTVHSFSIKEGHINIGFIVSPG